MKISDEEAIAALNSWIPEIRPATCEAYVKDMRAALAAAYTVRKARKAAKRAKAKPSILDEDQQDAMGQEIPARSYQSWYGGGELLNSAQAVPEPAAPAWNGKFEVGKAYRMRNGKMAIITFKRDVDEWVLQGETDTHTRLWRLNGRWGNSAAGTEASDTEYDLIGPWED